MPKLAKVSHAHYLQLFTVNQFFEETFSLNFSSLYWVYIAKYFKNCFDKIFKRIFPSKFDNAFLF